MGNDDGKPRRIEEIIQFLKDTQFIMTSILHQLEIEENYEACAELYEDINDITKEIIEHERIKYISETTGRQYNIY